jgi:hypothetical protein
MMVFVQAGSPYMHDANSIAIGALVPSDFTHFAKAPTIEELLTWDFNVFEYDEETLLWCCKEMLTHMDLVVRFDLPEAELHGFLRLLPHYYFDNPYHNLRHGVYVMHSAFVIMNTLGAGKVLVTPF